MPQVQWVVGFHAVESVLSQHPEDVLELLVLEGRGDRRLDDVVSTADSLGLACRRLPRAALEREIGQGKGKGTGQQGQPVHQGVAARCRMRDLLRDEAWLEKHLDGLDHAPLLLVLDGVTDPHNLGACLRSADAAGVDAVIMPRDRCAPVNTTVRKVACGAAETLALIGVTNLARTLKALKARGIWLAGAAGEADSSVYDLDLRDPTALVMGAEDSGLRRLTREQCDYLVALPMAGAVSSLNVSVATGVCLFEAVRQRCG
ncbi:MAG: 23S rRNA (guanosine(2251)-2'-O)-methyltransferase RlmB [Pseudohongiellaceae bacterium]